VTSRLKAPPEAIDVQKLAEALAKAGGSRKGGGKRRISYTHDPDAEQEIVYQHAGLTVSFPKQKKRGRPASSRQRDRDIARAYYHARAKGSRSKALQVVRDSVRGAAVLSDARLLRVAQQNRRRIRLGRARS
jgi:hypothetical protein